MGKIREKTFVGFSEEARIRDDMLDCCTGGTGELVQSAINIGKATKAGFVAVAGNLVHHVVNAGTQPAGGDESAANNEGGDKP